METLDPKSPNHILVGVGGTGGKVLKAIRKRIYQEFPNDEERDKLSIGFVYVDSTREMMTPGDPSFRVMGKDASFYNPQIQISAESETKRSIFREKDKTKRSKKESAQHSKSRNKSFVMTSVSAL